MKFKVIILTISLIVGLSNVLMSEDLPGHPKSPGAESLVPNNPTYFIGKWAGEWELPRGRQEADFLIEEEKGGKYKCTYSLGFFQATKNPIPPGSSSGVITFESDNTAIFRKQNYTIIFTKKNNDTLKARWERNGPTDPGKPAHYEGYYKRVK